MSHLRKLMQDVGARCKWGQLPSTYLVVDVETSGFEGTINPNGKPACVVQFGVASVRGRKLVSRNACFVQRPPGTMQPGATEANQITDDMLVVGMTPEDFYPRLIRLLETFRVDQCPYVGHNIVHFDMPFINSDIARHGFDFEIQPNEVIDTGMIYKANSICVAPGDYEPLGAFFKRVSDIRARAKWKLVLTMERLHLDTKFDLDLDKAHDAGYDCYMTYLLFEELRQLADGAPDGF